MWARSLNPISLPNEAGPAWGSRRSKRSWKNTMGRFPSPADPGKAQPRSSAYRLGPEAEPTATEEEDVHRLALGDREDATIVGFRLITKAGSRYLTGLREAG